jgi:DNA-binding MarR family transcriptional regulator
MVGDTHHEGPLNTVIGPVTSQVVKFVFEVTSIDASQPGLRSSLGQGRITERIVYCHFMMPAGVELREIRVFLTLADELHFGRAAKLLYVTPSNVSHTIRTLETRIGGRLFDRTSRRVTLTPLGEELKARITQSYETLNEEIARTQEIAAGVAGLVLAVSRDHRLARADRVSLEELAEERVCKPSGSYPVAVARAISPTHTPTGRPIPRVTAVRTSNEIVADVARGRMVHLTMPGVVAYQVTTSR